MLGQVKVLQSDPLGEEGEADFGAGELRARWARRAGVDLRGRLSASGAGFNRAYLNQAQQACLDGDVRAFEHFGGAPGRIRSDNLKPAVVRVLKGCDRAGSERFIAMRPHYGDSGRLPDVGENRTVGFLVATLHTFARTCALQLDRS